MRLRLHILSVFLGISGCASTQLNYNALNLASSLDSLNSRQIYYNLEQTLEDPFAIPSQVTIAAGMASTTNIISPSLTLPLGTSSVITSSLANTGTNSMANAVAGSSTNTVANTLGTTGTNTLTNAVTTGPTGSTTSATNTLANAVANNSSNVITNAMMNGTTNTATNGTTSALTNTTAITHPNDGLTMAFTDNWAQSWTLDPATDPDELRRLQALYRFVLGFTTAPDSTSPQANAVKFHSNTKYADDVRKAFMCEYPVQTAKPTVGESEAQLSAEMSAVRLNSAYAAVQELAAQENPDSESRKADMRRAAQEKAQALVEAESADRVANATRTSQALEAEGCAGSVETDRDGNKIKHKFVENADITFLRLPSCVICYDEKLMEKFVNPALEFGFIKEKPPTPTGYARLHWPTNLYVCTKGSKHEQSGCDDYGLQEFHNFVLFVYEATGQSTSPGTTKKPNSLVLFQTLR
jgi:hypothetical protein